MLLSLSGNKAANIYDLIPPHLLESIIAPLPNDVLLILALSSNCFISALALKLLFKNLIVVLNSDNYYYCHNGLLNTYQNKDTNNKSFKNPKPFKLNALNLGLFRSLIANFTHNLVIQSTNNSYKSLISNNNQLVNLVPFTNIRKLSVIHSITSFEIDIIQNVHDFLSNYIDTCILLENNQQITSLSLNFNHNFNHFAFINNVLPLSNQNLQTSLKTLKISSSKLSFVPNLSNFHKIKHLNLSNNNLSNISSLGTLQYLKSINLSRNQFSFIDPIDFDYKINKNLLSINLSHNSLSKIYGLNYLSNLLDLDLSNNQIYKIENLNDNTNLHFLNLSNNFIKSIENLNPLKNLKFLNLSNNKIERIENLNNLKNLISLNLEFNNIKRLYNISKNLNWDSLIELNLNQNDLSSLRYLKSSSPSNNLEILRLNNNSIDSIDEYLNLNFKNLNYLDLSFNRLFSVDNLPLSINSLNLLGNSLYEISNYLIDLRNLKFLDLSWNQITDINNDNNLKLLKFKNNVKVNLESNQHNYNTDEFYYTISNSTSSSTSTSSFTYTNYTYSNNKNLYPQVFLPAINTNNLNSNNFSEQIPRIKSSLNMAIDNLTHNDNFRNLASSFLNIS
ncbi:leucine-rich repeat domain-containing protein [Ascoidea rubescens DSM 1968]|uniref:L domain-like protein n=1 Tax=Ascoidea rubescens DSM 1968 TaxID=1344418 RepID=A0A1D2VG91_9ASCO|nr:L domain-like protein [Ascoidea rubescens DSM 1968]ODV60487.1 L domain-like protein [Ascoidea rubescens DSM 1968]